MWTCPKCGRIFKRKGQMHSCKKVPLESHFENKESAKELFDFLLKQIKAKVGNCKIISLPCCVHLFGKYDFLAALPKKDKLEVRFMLNRKITNPRITATVPLSSKTFKNCLDVSSKEEIDKELIGWIKESYSLRE